MPVTPQGVGIITTEILNQVEHVHARITSYNVCYTKLLRIDRLFFAERLPNPTFGTGGIPDPALFPREAFARAMARAVSAEAAGTTLQYAPSEGYLLV